MMKSTTADGPGDDPAVTSSHRLTKERIKHIGYLSAELLLQPTAWIDGRKDSIEVIDDTAVLWQRSVSFELPPGMWDVELADGTGERILCAPCFVAAKSSASSPSSYMAFHLVDERKGSLPPIHQVDCERISGQILVAMAELVIKRPVVPEVNADLLRIAESDPDVAKPLAVRRLDPLDGDLDDSPKAARDWADLRKSLRFLWWLRTLADSFVVTVLFRDDDGEHRRVKLSYEVPITPERRWQARLGWKPYNILIDSPFIEARSYHFECKAPSGMRVESAWLNDDVSPTPHEAQVIVSGGTYVRSAHIYRPDAESVGAGAGTVALRTSAEGFVTGAWLASLSVNIGLAASLLSAESIARYPSTAPALLLLLPGLLASYIGRPDHHALTTRMLSYARGALIAASFAAYVAGVKIALLGGEATGPAEVASRTDQLELVLGGCLALSLAVLATLSAAAVASRPGLRRRLRWKTWRDAVARRWRQLDFELGEVVRAKPADCCASLYGVDEACPLKARSGDRTVPELSEPAKKGVVRARWYGAWMLIVEARSHEGGCRATVYGHLKLRWPLRPLAGWLVRRERAAIDARMDGWARSLESPDCSCV